jgi:ATP:cob(I)alamin adenosyltransferase
MLYTRKGDSGTSGLFGTKKRYPKDSALYEALGSVDELNSLLGMCYAHARIERQLVIQNELRAAQEALFIVQAEIAGSEERLHQSDVDALERRVNQIEIQFQNPHSFVIPGATELSSILDYARAVGRRTERAIIRTGEKYCSRETRAYLNRLSSLLYALARYAAHGAGASETGPSYNKITPTSL